MHDQDREHCKQYHRQLKQLALQCLKIPQVLDHIFHYILITATFISLNALTLPVEGDCEPRHKSTKSPCLQTVMFSLSGMEEIVSILYFSP